VAFFRYFAWRYFVISRGVISLFRLAFFRYFAWRFFAWRLFATVRQNQLVKRLSEPWDFNSKPDAIGDNFEY
jgi:hypothetical protein